MMIEKRPRQYAAEIAAMSTREQRAAALAKVPDDLREWVQKLVEVAFEMKRKGRGR